MLGVAGIISAVAALLGAVTGLVVALRKPATPVDDDKTLGDRLWFEMLGRLEASEEMVTELLRQLDECNDRLNRNREEVDG